MATVSASKIIEIAQKEIGTKATDIKKCKYNTWYYGSEVSGSKYDWCAVFVCWLYNQAGAIDMIPTKSANCGVLAAGFNNKGKFYKSGFKAGDIVFFHWSSDKSDYVPGAYALDHVGIIEKVNADGTYTTIEGNTGSTTNGEVMRQIRSASVISGVARPDYLTSTTTQEDEEMIKYGLTNNAIWSYKQHLRTLKAMGVITTAVDNNGGFGEGTLKATKEIQKIAGIEVDGLVGPDTIKAVYTLETKAYNALTTKITNAKKALT